MNPRFNFQQSRGGTIVGRRSSLNTPGATVTGVPAQSQSVQDRITKSTGSVRETTTSGTQGNGTVKETSVSGNQGSGTVGETSASSKQNEENKPTATTNNKHQNTTNSNKNEQLDGGSSGIRSRYRTTTNSTTNNPLKVTTFKMPDDAKESVECKVSKTGSGKNADKSPFGTSSTGKGLTPMKQGTDSGQKATKSSNNNTKKLQYRNLKREPTIMVKVLTRESSKVPAETKIVIVDNKTKKDIKESDKDILSTTDSVKAGGSGIQRSIYINSSSAKHRSPEQNNQESGRKSSKSGRKSVKSVKGEVDLESEVSKTRVHTPHGSGGSSSEGITPVETSDTKVTTTTRYAVFPLSPYKQPVAQLKMTHRPRKAKSHAAVEAGNRGS